MKKLYRYVESFNSSIDEFENVISLCVSVNCIEYNVIKETPCGVRIQNSKWKEFPDEGKFVMFTYGCCGSTKKQFACKTKELAKASFLARKKRQLGILIAQTEKIRQAIIAGENIKIGEEKNEM